VTGSILNYPPVHVPAPVLVRPSISTDPPIVYEYRFAEYVYGRIDRKAHYAWLPPAFRHRPPRSQSKRTRRMRP
jgi:hypothetical protein